MYQDQHKILFIIIYNKVIFKKYFVAFLKISNKLVILYYFYLVLQEFKKIYLKKSKHMLCTVMHVLVDLTINLQNTYWITYVCYIGN